MTIEDRLRSAIANRTNRVEPSPDARARLEEKLMETQTDLNRKRWLVGIGAAVAAIARAWFTLIGRPDLAELFGA